MDSHAMTNDALLKHLRKAIDLPKGMTALTLTMRMGDAPRIEYSAICYEANGLPVMDGDKVKQETKTFRLVEVEDVSTVERVVDGASDACAPG